MGCDPSLQEFGPGLWLVDGPIVTAAIGFHYPTRMAVIRLSDGGLLVWSPIALSAEIRSAVNGLSEVRHLVAPNSLHHVFLSEWRLAYPSARLHAPFGLAEKRRDLAFDGELTEQSAVIWRDDLDLVVVRGSWITTEVVFFHRASRTVLFADLLQQFPPGWFRGWRALIARWDLMTADEPSVPRKFRLAFTNRASARAAIERILAWPAEKVVMAHGTPVLEDGRAFIRRAFAWLM
ncbi:DUF4336 domain-containing protein [Methylobacterium brachythecii]|uniref:DUF4336 domain-containing protein n=1 Tax=Methylobacterium brachythecii TaxID=1176177 RepID=A0A7W6AID1_9HYPH|nr:DUF4336 domain-containing protein [Methylobacterium brachythecii]MBB3903908.1 hypothetical protein [Methylobacterium brachythecii]GLS42655.1 hypothetical protein GCM10007884_06400 [Methylobacterium brachythecii]